MTKSFGKYLRKSPRSVLWSPHHRNWKFHSASIVPSGNFPSTEICPIKWIFSHLSIGAPVMSNIPINESSVVIQKSRGSLSTMDIHDLAQFGARSASHNLLPPFFFYANLFSSLRRNLFSSSIQPSDTPSFRAQTNAEGTVDAARNLASGKVPRISRETSQHSPLNPK